MNMEQLRRDIAAVSTQLREVISNQEAQILALAKVGKSNELIRGEVRSLALRHAMLDDRVTALEAGRAPSSVSDGRSLPPLEDFTVESPSKVHRIVDVDRYEKLREKSVKAERWDSLVRGSGKVLLYVASGVALLVTLLAGAAIVDAARHHPSLVHVEAP
jgi:hypothetical protein